MAVTVYGASLPVLAMATSCTEPALGVSAVVAVVACVIGLASEVTLTAGLVALDKELVSVGSEEDLEGLVGRRNLVLSQEESLEESWV